jgi:hypothetical protein
VVLRMRRKWEEEGMEEKMVEEELMNFFVF